jgi:hypothetical protein
MESILKIKNTIAFLEENNPSALAALKKKYPGNEDILEGKEKYGAEDDADTVSKQKAVLEATVMGLQATRSKVAPFQEALRKRLASAKNFRLLAALIAVFSSTVLVVFIGAKAGSPITRFVLAVINLVASALPLVATWLETSKYGGNKNMVDYLSQVNATFAEANTLERLLQKDLQLDHYDKDTITNIKKAEEQIMPKLYDIEQQLK